MGADNHHAPSPRRTLSVPAPGLIWPLAAALLVHLTVSGCESRDWLVGPSVVTDGCRYSAGLPSRMTFALHALRCEKNIWNEDGLQTLRSDFMMPRDEKEQAVFAERLIFLEEMLQM